MTVSNEQRQVLRPVKVFRCNRCRAEAVEDAGVAGWSMLIELELRSQPTMMGTFVDQLSAKPGADRHYCPGCTVVVRQTESDQVMPEMVGNDIANIPVRTTTGETVLLTRFEWERWALNGKPPILSVDQLKAKS